MPKFLYSRTVTHYLSAIIEAPDEDAARQVGDDSSDGELDPNPCIETTHICVERADVDFGAYLTAGED